MQLILIILPLLFQIIFGRKAIGNDIKLTFTTVCIISFLSQIIVTLLGFTLTAHYLKKNNNDCGIALAGIILFSLLATLILCITIIIQYHIKKSYEN